jgi:hypothetical protein
VDAIPLAPADALHRLARRSRDRPRFPEAFIQSGVGTRFMFTSQ